MEGKSILRAILIIVLSMDSRVKQQISISVTLKRNGLLTKPSAFGNAIITVPNVFLFDRHGAWVDRGLSRGSTDATRHIYNSHRQFRVRQYSTWSY